MSKSRSRPDIDTLLADRAKYEAWLDQIEAKASRVPGHVVERVRADYHERLTEVVNELRTRADDLRTEGNELEARIAVLDGELGGKRDARAEDELRALVGEYDETAWSEKAAEHDASIGTLETERSAREADLNRVRQLLGEATRPSRAMRAISEAEIPEEPTPAAPAIEVVAADAEGPVEVVAEAPSPSSAPAEPEVAVGLQAEPVVPPPEPELPPAPTPAMPDPATAKRPSPFDEIGFLRTVVGRATPYAGVELAAPDGPVARPSGAMPAAAARPSGAMPAAAARPSGAMPAAAARPSGAMPAPAEPAPRASEPVSAPVASTGRPSAAVASPPGVPVLPPPRASAPSILSMPTFDEPLIPNNTPTGVPEPRMSIGTSEPSRTLKCQECGWMNYPTEWYCEKCGGELAAF